MPTPRREIIDESESGVYGKIKAIHLFLDYILEPAYATVETKEVYDTQSHSMTKRKDNRSCLHQDERS